MHHQSMASTTTRMSPVIFLLLLVAAFFAAGASAASFTIKNNCGHPVWPMGVPVSGGTQLNPGQARTVDVPRGTSGSFWGVDPATAGCTFNVTTGHYDCPGQTTAEYRIAGGGSGTAGSQGQAQDYYDISVVGGYNLPMAFSCSTGVALVCKSRNCPDAYQYPTDVNKTHACSANSNYQVTFCP